MVSAVVFGLQKQCGVLVFIKLHTLKKYFKNLFVYFVLFCHELLLFLESS